MFEANVQAVCCRIENASYLPHGQQVVEYVTQNEGLMAFEKRWRRHFVDRMAPRHLPDLWSVDHSHDQLAGLERELKAVIRADREDSHDQLAGLERELKAVIGADRGQS